MRRDALEERTERPKVRGFFVRFGAVAATTVAIANPKRIIRE